MSKSDVVFRQAARVLVIDNSDRLLLFRGFDPAEPEQFYWFTTGGGIDPGETAIEAASRELREEIGLLVEPEMLGDRVFSGTAEFTFDGVPYFQEQEFFALRVPAFEVVQDGMEALERATITAHRWWSVEELETTDEIIHPVELPALFRELRDGVPS